MTDDPRDADLTGLLPDPEPVPWTAGPARGRRVLVLGLGSVARATLPLLLEHLPYPPSAYAVVDDAAPAQHVDWAREQGVSVTRERLAPTGWADLLAAHLGEGDLLVDLAWNTGTVDLLEWCAAHGVRFVNASLEVWDPYAEAASAEPRDRTLYARHMELRRRAASWSRHPSAVLDHGANPGLVSHFTKAALLDLGAAWLAGEVRPVPHPWTSPPSGERAYRVAAALADRRFAELAQALDVRTIHISERDTQISSTPKRVDEFANTWSVEGFYEESISPAELGWGTHERTLPAGAQQHLTGPLNQIALAEIGCRTWVRSWVPAGEIVGMVIRHGEAFSISEHLTVGESYRPTVHYAYCPADAAIASLHELEMRRLRLQPAQRVMTADIVSGRDELGVLLLGHPLTGWWYGSLLDIEQSRRLVPGQNATTVQVAAAVLAAACWLEDFPDEGVRLPDDLPHDYVLDRARPYLGPVVSRPTDWTPVADQDLLGSGPVAAGDDVWQFATFRVR